MRGNDINLNVYIYENVCERRVVGYKRLILFFQKNNINITRNIQNVDYVVFFACGMKTDNTKEFIRAVLDDNKKIVIYGCAAQMLEIKETGQITLISLYEYDKLNAFFRANIKYQDIDIYKGQDSLKEKQYVFTDALKSWDPRLIMPKCEDVYSITISEGCSNNCSYCAIHFATGQLKSRGVVEIVEEMEEAIAKGYVNFRIQCENSGSYGMDIGSNLGCLLDALGQIEKNYSIDIPDLHPEGFVKNIDSIIRFMEKKNIYLIHLPIQSASQKILAAMNRNYNIKQVEKALDKLLLHFPEIHIGTDIIIGFPGEDDRDFAESFDFLKKYLFNPLYVHGYCDKEGTIANDLGKKVSDAVKENRIRKIYSEFEYVACYLNNYKVGIYDENINDKSTI